MDLQYYTYNIYVQFIISLVKMKVLANKRKLTIPKLYITRFGTKLVHHCTGPHMHV